MISEKQKALSKLCLAIVLIHIFFYLVGLLLIGISALLSMQNEQYDKAEITIMVFKFEPRHEFAKANMPTEVNTNLNLDQRVIDQMVSSNPFKLSLNEIQEQYDAAKVSGLKKRFRRFACWHSCFGQFRKRTPVRKTKPSIPTTDGEVSITDKDSPAPSSDTNELGDANQGPRQKKSPAISGFYEEVANNELPDDKTSQNKGNLGSNTNLQKKAKAGNVKTTTGPPRVVLQSELEKGENPKASQSSVEEDYESGEPGESEGADAEAASYEEEDDEYYDDDKTGDEKADAENDDGVGNSAFSFLHKYDQDATEEEGS